MFSMIENPNDFLNELYKILKKDGILVIDDGYQSRKKIMRKIMDLDIWEIVEERKDCLMCMKV
jgi:ubiquinone/menaquinone biosynthesis C-methylase UbiE